MKTTSRRRLLLALSAAVALSACTKSADQPAAGNGALSKVVIGLDDNFPPMGFCNEKNELVG